MSIDVEAFNVEAARLREKNGHRRVDYAAFMAEVKALCERHGLVLTASTEFCGDGDINQNGIIVIERLTNPNQFYDLDKAAECEESR